MVTIIYHASCPDGWASAYLLLKYFKSRDPQTKFSLLSCLYNEESYAKIRALYEKGRIPGRTFMVDFSMPPKQLLELQKNCENLVVMDHHATAMVDLAPIAAGNESWLILDQNECGASLVAKYVTDLSKTVTIDPYEDQTRRFLSFLGLIPYIRDRDLWKWEMAASREVSAYLSLYAYTEEAWDTLIDGFDLKQAVNIGEGCIRKQQSDIARSLSTMRTSTLPGPAGTTTPITVGMVASYQNGSEIGEAVYDGGLADLAVIVSPDIWTNEIRISLRSKKVNCGELAKKYGGGGHPGAAGCSFKTFNDALIAFGFPTPTPLGLAPVSVAPKPEAPKPEAPKPEAPKLDGSGPAAAVTGK